MLVKAIGRRAQLVAFQRLANHNVSGYEVKYKNLTAHIQSLEDQLIDAEMENLLVINNL